MIYIIGQGAHAEVVKHMVTTPSCLISVEDFEHCSTEIKNNDTFICAIGDNQKRKDIISRNNGRIHDEQWINVIHAHTTIAQDVKLGRGNVICAGVVIQPGSTIEDHCIINTNASVDHHADIRSFVHVAPNAALCGNVKLGEGCFVATSVSIMPKVSLAPWTFVKATSLVKYSNSPITMYTPTLPPETMNDVALALNCRALTSATPFCSFVTKCEKYLADMLKCKHVLLMNNGTSATHCLYLALKFKYPNLKRIYVPNYVYVAV